MDSTQFNGAVAAIAALVGVAAKSGWAAYKSKKDGSAAVQTAQIADDAAMRGELWTSMTKMQIRMDQMQTDLDTVRREYVELLGEHAILRAEHASLKREHETLQIRYAALESRVNNSV